MTSSSQDGDTGIRGKLHIYIYIYIYIKKIKERRIHC